MEENVVDPISGLSRRIAERYPAKACLAALWGMSLAYRVKPLLPSGEGRSNGARKARIPCDSSATLQFGTSDGENRVWARFSEGKMRPGRGCVEPADVTVTFRTPSRWVDFFSRDGATKTLLALLDNSVAFDGNLAVLAHFGYIASALALGTTPLARPAHKPLIDDNYFCRSATITSAGCGRPDGAFRATDFASSGPAPGPEEPRWSRTHRSGC